MAAEKKPIPASEWPSGAVIIQPTGGSLVSLTVNVQHHLNSTVNQISFFEDCCEDVCENVCFFCCFARGDGQNEAN